MIMTPDITENVEEFDEDINTTAPQEKPAPTWTMPEPVFRKTSGRLPKDFPKRNGEADSGNVGSSSAQATSLDPDPAPKSLTLKIVVVILALVGMMAFLAVFLTLVYFFFLR